MPLTKRPRELARHRQLPSQPVQDGQARHPHPLKSNSVHAATMRRPTFFLKRQRSNSVPNMAFANVSAEEAGIIFSAAERAAARRRRPVSEYSPDLPAGLADARHNSLPAADAADQELDSSADLSCRWEPQERSGRLSTVPEAGCPTSPAPSPMLDSDDLSSVGSIDEPVSPLTAPSPMPYRLPSLPPQPKRTVQQQCLKNYADSMLAFTQARLNKTVPNAPLHLGLLVPHLKVDPEPCELYDRRASLDRPALASRFSEWSSTTVETDAETDARERLARWSSSVQTPDWSAGVDDFNELDMLTPDSFFAEVTPRIAQAAKWADSTSSPAWNSRASSPTRASLRSRGSLSLPRPSPAPSDAASYFSNFDGYTAAAVTQLNAPAETPSADALRPPSAAGALLARRTASPVGRQMVDLSAGPPSWLTRAIG